MDAPSGPTQRPPFLPGPGHWEPLGSSKCLGHVGGTQTGCDQWIPLIHCQPSFPAELFEAAVSQLVHHPEYNSTLILRSETISDKVCDLPPDIPLVHGHYPVRNVHRKLLPRRPGRDNGIEQYCTLYCAEKSDPQVTCDISTPEEPPLPSLLILTPIVDSGSSLPYYHPAVFHLAFRYLQVSPHPLPQHPSQGVLQVEVSPLPGTSTDINSRLYRTCLALLEALHRYGWGTMTGYKKRVIHDCIIPREEYQDLYLVIRERHRAMVSTWKESTDPLKHVFEDIGIATFLILLWKQMYPTRVPADGSVDINSSSEPWRSWGRPPGGFLDLGCGNGLLTHILVSEGYDGLGIDLRARTSWDYYPSTSRAHLRVEALNPTSSLAQPDAEANTTPGVFLIGNHADELTPWIPILATLRDASGYLSIPCCPWTFDAKYERSTHLPYPTTTPMGEFITSLGLGGDGSNTSSYSMYRIWLATLHAHCGWSVECETLRIPSTRNWALVGRLQHPLGDGRVHAEGIVEEVRKRGVFKTRRPEGKPRDHW